MKGYSWTGTPGPLVAPTEGSKLAPWESVAVEVVGNVIEFWGFKRNQGRVWALIYLRNTPMTALELEEALSLSKGGVSMLLRDLERWGVVLRARVPGSGVWHYRAEVELMRMLSRVIEEREAGFIARVREDLAEARRLAAADGDVAKERLGRLDRIYALAVAFEKALRLFLKTSKLDVGQLLTVFREGRTALRS
jgi:DNA-binding transcriptional regulator GbsR (MarR family)